jgi:hypothetical protein
MVTHDCNEYITLLGYTYIHSYCFTNPQTFKSLLFGGLDQILRALTPTMSENKTIQMPPSSGI